MGPMQPGDQFGAGDQEASVRPATSADLGAIGAVHARAWRSAYADLLPADVLAALTPEVLADAWRPAVADPPSPRHRVLLACWGATVVGFCASAPAADPPGAGEVVTLLVDPSHQRRGHASRLLAATVEHLQGDGTAMVVAWSPAGDLPRQGFLAAAGFGPDGAHRELALPGEGTLREVRLVAALT